MRLSTFEFKGRRRIGAVVDDRMVDLSASHAALIQRKGGDPGQALPNDMIGLLELGEAGLAAVRAAVDYARDQQGDRPRLSYGLTEVQLKAPIPRPGKILAAEFNYPDHLREANNYIRRLGHSVPDWPLTDWPWTFPKLPCSVIGPSESIVRPRITDQLDGEVELAVVIGRKGRSISEDRAMEYVIGYTVMIDVSARDVEFTLAPVVNHRLYGLGKNNDTFAPMGPFLVTRDEVAYPQALELCLRRNGEVVQHGNTMAMLVPVQKLIAFYSVFLTLDPGDVILTGTPGGVGGFREPPVYWQPGDRLVASVAELGDLELSVVQET